VSGLSSLVSAVWSPIEISTLKSKILQKEAVIQHCLEEANLKDPLPLMVPVDSTASEVMVLLHCKQVPVILTSENAADPHVWNWLNIV
jgi:hypothetical protein